MPRDQNCSAEKGLSNYFRKINSANFKDTCPDLYQFLLAVQPIVNDQYIWLEQLYDLANQQKHEEDLASTPSTNGLQIEMREFFPQVFAGLISILLKLSFPKASEDTLKECSLSHFFVKRMKKPIKWHSKVSIFSKATGGNFTLTVSSGVADDPPLRLSI